MVTVERIVSGGFQLVRERPLAALVWGTLYTAIAVGGSLLVLRPMMAAQMAGGQPGVTPPAEFLVRMIPLYIAYIVFGVIFFSAALRAALRLDDGRFASIRLSMDELRIAGVSVVLILISTLVVIVGVLVMALLAGGLAALGGAAGGTGTGIFVAVIIILMLFVYAAAFLVQVRLSPALALTMLRRKVIIGEAWRLTRGKFWTLFGGYLVLALILMVGYAAVAAITLGPYLADLGQSGFSPQGMQAAGRLQFERQMGGLSVTMVLGWIASALLTGVVLAVWAGAFATATRGLLGPDAKDYAETFA